MTREEAISDWTFRSNHIKKWLDEHGEEPSIRHYVELIDIAIEALLAVRPTGEWLVGDAWPHNVYCSNCYATFVQENWSIWKDERLPRNYCPNCGAKMNKGGDSE